MIFNEKNYFRKNRNFDITYNIDNVLEYKMELTNKLTNSVFDFSGSTGSTNQYFIVEYEDVNNVIEGFYAFTLYLKKDGNWVKYEKGLLLKEISESTLFYDDDETDEKNYYVDDEE